MGELYQGGTTRSQVSSSQWRKRKKQANKSYKKGEKIKKMLEAVREIDQTIADKKLLDDLSSL